MTLESRLPIAEAGPLLISTEIRENLIKGLPIQSNLRNGRLTPYLYPDNMIGAVTGYCLSQKTLYSSDSFRENIRQYFQTFRLPDNLPITQKKTSHKDRVPLIRKGFTSKKFVDLEDVEPPDEKLRILMHGRFNGFPPPAVLETVLLMKKELPEYEFYLGIDDDTSSIKLSQTPFMDVQFRASLLARMGLFDKIILLKPDYFWDDLYAKGSRLDSHVIICSANEKIDEKRWQEIPTRTAIIVAEEMSREIRGMHQTTIKSGATSVEEVRRGWEVVRRLLGDPGET